LPEDRRRLVASASERWRDRRKARPTQSHPLRHLVALRRERVGENPLVREGRLVIRACRRTAEGWSRAQASDGGIAVRRDRHNPTLSAIWLHYDVRGWVRTHWFAKAGSLFEPAGGPPKAGRERKRAMAGSPKGETDTIPLSPPIRKF